MSKGSPNLGCAIFGAKTGLTSQANNGDLSNTGRVLLGLALCPVDGKEG
jgi:hypothetical protein